MGKKSLKERKLEMWRKSCDGRLATRAIPFPGKDGEVPRSVRINKEDLKRDLHATDQNRKENKENDDDTDRRAR